MEKSFNAKDAKMGRGREVWEGRGSNCGGLFLRAGAKEADPCRVQDVGGATEGPLGSGSSAINDEPFRLGRARCKGEQCRGLGYRLARILVKFWLVHWQWLIGIAVAIILGVVTL